MQGLPETDGDFTIVPCPAVTLRSLGQHDVAVSDEPLVQERHRYPGQTVSCGHIVNANEVQSCAQSHPAPQNIKLGFLNLRDFLAHPGITPMMPETLPRYSQRPKL